jgi:hypothetical protein
MFYCEGPDCESHVSTATPAPYVPIGFIATHESEPGNVEAEHHFCGWTCLMKFAADMPIPEVIE